MENVVGYDNQGMVRQEFGHEYNEAYYAYDDGTLTIVLPGELRLSKATNLRIVLSGSQISNIAGNQTITANAASVTVANGYTINGNLTVTGDVNVTGNCNIGGQLTVSGLITSATDVIGRGVSLATHRHNGAHGITSGPM